MRVPLEERVWRYVDQESSPHGCWLWIGAGSPGYGRIVEGGGGKGGRLLEATHVFWKLTTGEEVPPGKCLCHDCPGGDNPQCVNPGHLFIADSKGNLRDFVAKGGWTTAMRARIGACRQGERHHRARLNEATVLTLRQQYPVCPSNTILQTIADQHGVALSTIGHILRGYSWKHLLPTTGQP